MLYHCKGTCKCPSMLLVNGQMNLSSNFLHLKLLLSGLLFTRCRNREEIPSLTLILRCFKFCLWVTLGSTRNNHLIRVSLYVTWKWKLILKFFIFLKYFLLSIFFFLLSLIFVSLCCRRLQLSQQMGPVFQAKWYITHFQDVLYRNL